MMMYDPVAYYETLKGKTKEEIYEEIVSLKEGIKELKKIMKNPDHPANYIMTSPKTRLSVDEEYLKMAEKAYEEAGGVYRRSKKMTFDEKLEELDSLVLETGGYALTANCKRTYTIKEDGVYLKNEEIIVFRTDEQYGKEILFAEKEAFLEALKKARIGTWKRNYVWDDPEYIICDGVWWRLELRFRNGKRAVKREGSNNFPEEFDTLLDALKWEDRGVFEI